MTSVDIKSFFVVLGFGFRVVKQEKMKPERKKIKIKDMDLSPPARPIMSIEQPIIPPGKLKIK